MRRNDNFTESHSCISPCSPEIPIGANNGADDIVQLHYTLAAKVLTLSATAAKQFLAMVVIQMNTKKISAAQIITSKEP